MARGLITTLAIAAGCALGPFAAQATTFSFTTLDDQADPTFNQLLGINDSGVIAGYFGSGAAGHPNKGYTIAPPYTKFVPDNYPGSVQTQATGINNHNQTSGFWSDSNRGDGTDNNFGFVRVKTKPSKFVGVVNPHVSGTPLITQALGINNNDNVAGFYNDANGNSHGFAFLLSSGGFTAVKVPQATSVAATGLNDHNLICGFYTKGAITYGFTKPETGGSVVSFRPTKKALVTQFLGINNAGVAVGFYQGSDDIPHGLYYDPASGWLPVNDPNGAQGTVVNGLNNKGQLVGFYTDGAGNTHGMIVTVHP